MKRILVAFGFSLLAAAAQAADSSAPAVDDLGTVGPQWPIEETDMLEAILARAREMESNGEAQKLKQRMQQQARDYVTTPPSLNLPRAAQDRSIAFDPSFVMPQDIKDATGRLLVAAGTRVNPLEHFAFDETLLFVDASDLDQVNWLKQRLAGDHSIGDKVILTGGSPTDLTRQLKQQVYFDQNGALVRKFGIEAVPATVLADPQAPRKQLLVQEYDAREKSP